MIKKIFLISAFLFSGFCVTNAQDYIIYSNYNDNNYMYRKNANDTGNGSAITSVPVTYNYYSPDGQYIIFTGPSGYMYRKNANDTGNGLAITSSYATAGVYSPDGQYIIYTNQSDGGKLYRKNANDTGNGSAITSNIADLPQYSPDGQYIVYTNGNDGGKLYRKNANDTGDGSAITSNIAYGGVYSPDGQYIIYLNGNDNNYLYRKNANDTGNGSAITSVDTRYATYSPDGQYIVYSNYSDSLKLYRKNANDTGNGSAINSNQSINPIYSPIIGNCYQVNIGKGFTGTIVQDDLFSTLGSSGSYDIQFGSGTKNTFLISSISGTEKFSYTFKENGGQEVEYYNDGELCTDNSCIKDSLFGGDFGDYIYSPNANFFSNNINTKFYVNTNFDNVVGFSLSSINENFTYSLYGRPDGETSYKYLGAFKSYTWNNIGGTAFEQRGELKYYSDFYVIIPRQYIGFGRYIHHVTLWYGGEYGDLYKTVCEYNDGSYTIDGNEATQEEVQSVINEGENKGNNVFDTGSTIGDSDITQDIWNIDSDGDGNISTWEQVTAPYTIAKNLVNKFIDSLKNVWNLLKSIQNIGNIGFIENTYASNSASGILNPISEKTKSMLNGTSERDGINNVFNIIQWGVFAIALLTIIMTFLILKIKK